MAAWNERDATRRMQLLELACTDDLFMRTPGRTIRGREALDALIADFQRRMPGHRAVLSGAVEVQGDLVRYVGVVEDPTGAQSGETFDAAECAEDGRLRVLLTFNGRGPTGTR